MKASELTPAEQLCLGCGMCCSGALHPWTYLQPKEVELASRQGLQVVKPTRRNRGGDPRPIFRQPCPALMETTCTIYRERPEACRKYTCHVLGRLQSGELGLAEAQEVVGAARQLIAQLQERMPYPLEFLSLDWQVRINWPPKQALPAEVEPIFSELTELIRREWRIKWRRTRRLPRV